MSEEESSPAIPRTSDNEAKQEDSGTDTIYRVRFGILSLALSAIIIGSKFLTDEVSACRRDVAWLLVFGIDLIAFDAILERYHRFPGNSFRPYTLGWSMYGVVLFTKAESAEQCEPQLHLFGLVLAIFGIVAHSLFFCCCGWMIITAILGGGSRGASAMAKGAQVV